MKFEFPSCAVAVLAIGEIFGCIKATGLTTNVATVSAFVPSRRRLGTDADIYSELR
jgi:hypothetical protein